MKLLILLLSAAPLMAQGFGGPVDARRVRNSACTAGQAAAYDANNRLTGCGAAGGGANASASSVAAVTSLTVNVSALGATSTNQFIYQCRQIVSPFGVIAATMNPASLTSVTLNFASTANIVCTVNATGATGATGPKGDQGDPGPAGANGAISLIQDEGTGLTVRPTINFTGAGVTATDDSANNRTLVTVSASGGAGSVAALSDFALTRTSNTVLTINPAASASAPVIMSCGNSSTQITAPGTITLTSGAASVSGFIYVNCATGSPVLTFGHNSANTYTGSADVTIATGITGFPAGSVNRPLWLATGTAGVWGSVAPANDRRSAFNSMKQLTAGANVTLTETAGQVQIASTGGAAFDPLDWTTLWERVSFQRLAYTSIVGTGWWYSGGCSGATSIAASPNEATGVGFTSPNCWIMHPQSTPDSSLPVFLHGATPKPYATTIRAGRGPATGDIYFGWSSSASNATTGNFVGVRWRSAASAWQCVIRSAGVDVAATNITGSVSDTNLHTFTISNDATANRVQCTFDGGATTTTSGTIPVFSAMYFLLGTADSTTSFNIRSLAYRITGLTQ